MRIGFIGAGKMGFTLGRHICEGVKNELIDDSISVAGYYSLNSDSAREAAQFTDTKYYDSIKQLVDDCDTLFLTVPDGKIAEVAKEVDAAANDHTGKIICHTSGVMSSSVFSGMDNILYGYSIHPMYAVSSKTESYINFNQCFVTIEGHDKFKDEFKTMFERLGHKVKFIDADDKSRYHGAAVFSSNLVIGLYKIAVDELVKCGFSESEANEALRPLFVGNAKKMAGGSIADALTGPIERCDISTVGKHLAAFSGDAYECYKLLSRQLVDIAIKKHDLSDSDEGYMKLKEILK